ncbi:MAG: ABC transporter permease [Planctomycetales bacterium]|nr:ABC transporter permease [Planctomycetales bacterium]
MSPGADAPAERSPVLALAGVALLEASALAAPRRLVVLVLLSVLPPAAALLLDAIRAAELSGEERTLWVAGFLYIAHLRALVPVAALYVGSSLLPDESEGGTLPYLLTRPVPRAGILGAKWLAAWVAVSGFALASALATALAFGILGAGVGGVLAPLLVALPAAAAAYLAVFGLLGVLTSRALILGLLYGLLFDFLLAQTPLLARRIALAHWASSALLPMGSFRNLLDAFPILPETVASPASAWVALAGITAGALALGGLRLRHRQHAPTRET